MNPPLRLVIPAPLITTDTPGTRLAATAALEAVFANAAYGVAVIACRGLRGVYGPVLPFVRTPISSHRAEPSKTLPPKSSVTAKSPLLTGTAALVSTLAIYSPFVGASASVNCRS